MCASAGRGQKVKKDLPVVQSADLHQTKVIVGYIHQDKVPEHLNVCSVYTLIHNPHHIVTLFSLNHDLVQFLFFLDCTSPCTTNKL